LFHKIISFFWFSFYSFVHTKQFVRQSTIFYGLLFGGPGKVGSDPGSTPDKKDSPDNGGVAFRLPDISGYKLCLA
jgi:hypothetical protein